MRFTPEHELLRDSLRQLIDEEIDPEHALPGPVGILLDRATDRAVRASRVKLVLEKSGAFESGFFILTGFPVL